MDKNRFNREVRPCLTVIPIGSQGVVFDRLDLDAWVEEYKATHGRPGRNEKGGKAEYQGKRRRVSGKEAMCGGFGSTWEGKRFAKALEQAKSKKRKESLPTS